MSLIETIKLSDEVSLPSRLVSFKRYGRPLEGDVLVIRDELISGKMSDQEGIEAVYQVEGLPNKDVSLERLLPHIPLKVRYVSQPEIMIFATSRSEKPLGVY